MGDRTIKPDMTPDVYGRIPMICESGLALTKVSMTRFIMHVLKNNIELLSIYAFDPNFHGSIVIASMRIKPEQIEEFETETGGKLKFPATINLN